MRQKTDMKWREEGKEISAFLGANVIAQVGGAKDLRAGTISYPIRGGDALVGELRAGANINPGNNWHIGPQVSVDTAKKAKFELIVGKTF